MKDFYITLKSGLLDKKHIQNMQVNQKTCAIWLYLWFLDKVTKIEDGMGVVLGGKPFKLTDFDLTGVQKTRMMFQQLQKHNYITTTKTPYGNIVYITKVFKIFGQKSARAKASENIEKVQGLAVKNEKSARANKTRQIDNINIILLEIISYWNEVFTTRYQSITPLVDNVSYWLEEYTLAQIKEAIKNIPQHDYWSDKMTPTIFFRRMNPRREKVDYIGEMLNIRKKNEFSNGYRVFRG